jgi:hypothetical protein
VEHCKIVLTAMQQRRLDGPTIADDSSACDTRIERETSAPRRRTFGGILIAVLIC